MADEPIPSSSSSSSVTILSQLKQANGEKIKKLIGEMEELKRFIGDKNYQGALDVLKNSSSLDDRYQNIGLWSENIYGKEPVIYSLLRMAALEGKVDDVKKIVDYGKEKEYSLRIGVSKGGNALTDLIDNLGLHPEKLNSAEKIKSYADISSLLDWSESHIDRNIAMDKNRAKLKNSPLVKDARIQKWFLLDEPANVQQPPKPLQQQGQQDSCRLM